MSLENASILDNPEGWPGPSTILITRNLEKSQTVSASKRIKLQGTIGGLAVQHGFVPRGNQVCSVPIEIAAAERARILAELFEALERAHRAIAGLQLRPEQRTEVEELYLRIEAAKLAVQSLRLSRSLNVREEFEPEWIDPLLRR